MLNISGLSEGIVIDHIQAGGAMKIYEYLNLEKMDCQVAIIKNAKSSKMGRKDIIKRIDKQRANHYKYYTEKEWNDSANYDISINSDTLGVEKTAELICQIVEEKIETK